MKKLNTLRPGQEMVLVTAIIAGVLAMIAAIKADTFTATVNFDWEGLGAYGWGAYIVVDDTSGPGILYSSTNTSSGSFTLVASGDVASWTGEPEVQVWRKYQQRILWGVCFEESNQQFHNSTAPNKFFGGLYSGDISINHIPIGMGLWGIR